MGHTTESDRGRFAADSVGMNQGMRVLSNLIAGVVLYGALGWVGDHFLHTGFLLPIGIVLGAALGIYTTIRRLAATGELGTGDGATPADQTTQRVTEGER